ncbi:MAG: hypothetical protein K0B09_12830 [Bacteroidales bacterium]|nr:hypothetical protein [Bacteroidales bacterium]
MKRTLLASIFGFFLFAGTGLILIASEPVVKETTAQAACCETAAKAAEKTADAGCASATPVQTASTSSAAGCGSTAEKASSAADCGSTAVQTASTSAAGDCGSTSVQTTQAEAGDCVKRPAGVSPQRAENR